MFLTTTRFSGGKNFKYSWGCGAEGHEDEDNYSGSLFSGIDTEMRDLVIYIDGDESVLSDLNNIQTTFPNSNMLAWNAEQGGVYTNGLSINAGSNNMIHALSRSHIPTYYNIDWKSDEGILYWTPPIKNNREGSITSTKPETLDDYMSGIISMVKEKNSNDYVVGRYYTNDDNVADEIDLTDGSLGVVQGHIKEIGDEAFAVDSNGQSETAGKYFILPSSIETIGERAFFRNSSSKGVKVVTYRDASNALILADGYSLYGDGSWRNTSGFCALPKNIYSIGRNAFYNNDFASVDVSCPMSENSGLANHIGNGAFYSNNAAITSINVGTNLAKNELFEVGDNGGLYHSYATDEKVLLYEPQVHPQDTTTLTLDRGTTAIAMHACAKTNYEKIILNSELQYIYGGGFQKNASLTEVEIPDDNNLKYIGGVTSPADSAEDIYSDDMPFDNINYRDTSTELVARFQSSGAVFESCTSLTTFDFTKLTELKKIGHWAFRNCSSLTNMAGEHNYTFYTSDSANGLSLLTENKNSGVLDLSNCTNLTSIGRESFYGCTGIEFAILPNSTDEFGNMHLYVGRDEQATWANNFNTTSLYGSDGSGTMFGSTAGVKILVGDKPRKAVKEFSVDKTDTNSHYYYTSESNCWYKGNIPYYYVDSKTDLTDLKLR